MSETREQLARQTETLSSIRSIVRTMKTLSAINAPPYEQAARDIKAYQQSLEKGFAAFAYGTQGCYAQHDLSKNTLATSSQIEALHIIFGSDHGLCGSYNEQLAHYFTEQNISIHKASANKVKILCIGARMERALQDKGLHPYQSLMPPASVKGIGRLANVLVQNIQAYSQQQGLQTSQVHLWFTQKDELTGHQLKHIHLLPVPHDLFKPKQTWDSTSLPLISMEREALFIALIRQYLFVHLYRASAEAIATENAARLALMKQAEETVADRLAEVKQKASQARQEEITTELMDIVMGHLAKN